MTHHLPPLSAVPISLLLLLLLIVQLATVTSHGFLSTPRSRNLLAYEDRSYYPVTSDHPEPEDCPNCLNRGGTLSRCGIINPGTTEERNYDTPKNALGEPMHTNIQSTYIANSVIDVEVQLTAHHRGHFVFSACPISNTTTIPTQECFDAYPLTFISDTLYGANVDTNHPERVYVAPDSIPNKVYSTKENFHNAMVFQYKLQLPHNLTGDLVLLQWYYVASNSACIHKGYSSYSWPEEWLTTNSSSTEWNQVSNVAMGMTTCDEVLPPDGNGIPEQFWNCAEIRILNEDQQLEEEGEDDGGEVEFAVIPSRNHSKTIIGYYASWQWYDRNKLAEPSNMDFTKVTRV